MACCRTGQPEATGRVQQHSQAHAGVAFCAGIRSAPGRVLRDEVLHDVVVEGPGGVERKMRNAETVRHSPRPAHVFGRTATPLVRYPGGTPHSQGESDHPEALLLHQKRGNGAVDPATHAYKHSLATLGRLMPGHLFRVGPHEAHFTIR